MDPRDPSCWTCTYQQIGGGNLLGFCRWFVVHLNQGAKEIPRTVVDDGCEHYERKERNPAAAAPRYPMVPHGHTCKGCADRHRWECQNRACTWSLMLDCATAKSKEGQKTA